LIELGGGQGGSPKERYLSVSFWRVNSGSQEDNQSGKYWPSRPGFWGLGERVEEEKGQRGDPRTTKKYRISPGIGSANSNTVSF